MRTKGISVYLAGRLFLCLCIGLFLVALAVMPAGASSAAMPAFVRVVHASPDIGTADVFLDGKTLLSNFAFGTVTGYATVPPGPHKVQVALIGKGIGASTITQTLNVSPGVAYTVAALGTKAMGFSLQAFIDNNQLSPGAAKVRFYHLSPGTGAVTITSGGTTVVQGLAYQQASAYVDLKSGSYTFQVAATQPTLSIPITATLKPNTVTSEFAVGVVNGTPSIEFVSSQATGIPGLPQTGSDPNAVVTPQAGNSSPLMNPLWDVLIILTLAGASIACWRWASYRKM